MKNRIAAHLYEKQFLPKVPPGFATLPWAELPADAMIRDLLMEEADALLAAIYEPTEEMVRAGGSVHSRNPAVAWRAMITVARGQPTGGEA